mgnify:CR=1 FL=1
MVKFYSIATNMVDESTWSTYYYFNPKAKSSNLTIYHLTAIYR